jgi:CxxC-x17-CxxC domain-containing protein
MADINFFGETNFRNTRRKFGIKTDDRRRHFYAIGKTGMGKTEMLKNMAVQDIQNGHGMGFVDPHGEAVEDLLDFVPAERIQDVIYFNPADTRFPIAFNVMEQVNSEDRHMVASGLMSVFKKIWPDVWSARMEYILNNVILALLECKDSTLLGINRMLTDPVYRQQVVEQVQDPVVRAFWVQEYSRYTQRYEVEATAAIQNKVGQFTSNPLIRNIVGQTRSTIDMREVMDGKKILLANISKGRIGEDNSRLLGGLLITKLQLAAMSRVDIPEDQRQDFFLYIDEFQHFATESFVNILSEARKYRLSLILSHQYIAQLGVGMEAQVRDAVFGNVGTIVSFRIGAEDAEALEKEFFPEFIGEDFVNLGKYTIYVKLMIDGVASRPFSAGTLPPPRALEKPNREEIIEFSRGTYGTALQEVEDAIRAWSEADENSSVPVGSVLAVSQNAQEQILYDARCSECGKDTKVVFPPDGKRPVYCKSCRKKLSRQREEKAEEPERQEERRDEYIKEESSGILQESDKEKKTPDREGLRGILRQALDHPPQKEPVARARVKKDGVLEPGQPVHFNR